MLTSRINVGVAVVNDKLYAIGGATLEIGNNAFASAVNEQYTPIGYHGPADDTVSPIDNTAPRIAILSPENKTYYTPDIPLNFTVNEPVSWIRYNLDAQNNVTITGNTTLTGLSYGSHNLTLYATDAADNTGASETITFTIAKKQEPEPFPITLVAAASIASAAVVIAGLLVYYRKRKH